MYSSREVSELVGLSMDQVRRFARAGFLSPERTPRKHYRFSFQDLTFLRSTTALFATHLPRRRVHHALRELRRQRRDRPLSELQITAGEQGILANDGEATWDPVSGQMTFDFAESDETTTVSPFNAGTPHDDLPIVDEAKAEEWFERGAILESSRPMESRQAYRRALALNPSHTSARVNLGRLLHAEGQIEEAIEHYSIVLTATPDNAIAAFDLGVALEDLDRGQDALAAYAQAIAADPNCADAHFNIAKLYEATGDELAALRHLRTYRELVRK